MNLSLPYLEILYNSRIDFSFHYANLVKHNVSPDEVEQALDDPNGWSEKSIGGTYMHLGKTAQGRLLETGYRKLTATSAFVFHANGRARQSAKTL